MAAQLTGPDVRVEKRRGKLGEIRVTVDGRDAYTGSRIWYPTPGAVVAAVRARLAEPLGEGE